MIREVGVGLHAYLALASISAKVAAIIVWATRSVSSAVSSLVGDKVINKC